MLTPCASEANVTLTASCRVAGGGGGSHSPHCRRSRSSGVKSISPHKFHPIAEQNVTCSARTACLWGGGGGSRAGFVWVCGCV